MRYVRTKDGRILEESKLEPGLKQTCITLIRKRDNKTLTQIICDDMDDHVEMIVVGEYCKCHKINPKEIRYERIVLLNEVLKQADAIEDLCDEFVWVNTNTNERKVMPKEADHKETAKYFSSIIVYGAIWITGEHGEPILKSVAKFNDKGELCLL